jgi:hypothetical protein
MSEDQESLDRGSIRKPPARPARHAQSSPTNSHAPPNQHLERAKQACLSGDYNAVAKHLSKAWFHGGRPHAREIQDLALIAREQTRGRNQKSCDWVIERTQEALAPPRSPRPPLPRTATELVQPDGSIRCAKCGSTQFETKISVARKLTVGVASVLGSGNEIQCYACGTKYKRQ